MKVPHKYLGNKKDIDSIDIQLAETLPDGTVKYKFEMVYTDPTVVPFVTDLGYLQNHLDDVLKDLVEYLNSSFNTRVMITDTDLESGQTLTTKEVSHLTKQMHHTVPRFILKFANEFLSLRRIKLFENLNMATYRYAVDTSGESIVAGIECLVCGMTSYHPEDVKGLYCGSCNKFHQRKA